MDYQETKNPMMSTIGRNWAAEAECVDWGHGLGDGSAAEGRIYPIDILARWLLNRCMYRVIHVASHAMADALIMGLSTLALSAFDPTGRKLDNLVFAADFATLRLNADLVVLSACDTSLGKDVAGEGLMGLRYITLARGAEAVVASLWEVPDESTAELMTAFYRSFLRDHRTVTAALSDAKRRMLSASNADPSVWGSFTAATTTIASRHER